MKGLILSSLASILIASASIAYADTIRITSINESNEAEYLKITSSKPGSINNRTYPIGSANIKMFTAEYTYPNSIFAPKEILSSPGRMNLVFAIPSC